MGGDALIDKVDWDLPRMDEFTEDDINYFKRELSSPESSIVYTMASLGWALWPTKNRGFYDELLLRKIADFIEIQNKPFWDDYNAYHERYENQECDGGCGHIHRDCQCQPEIVEWDETH